MFWMRRASAIEHMATRELTEAGGGQQEVRDLLRTIRQSSPSRSAAERWKSFMERSFDRSAISFPLFQILFERNYRRELAPDGSGVAPVWWPKPNEVAADPMTGLIRSLGATTYNEAQRSSRHDRAGFWKQAIADIGIVFRRDPEAILEESDDVAKARWLRGARFNIAESLLKAESSKEAVVFADECGRSGSMTYAELDRESNRIANSLRALGLEKGDTIVIHMPMSPESVALEIGALKAGVIVATMATSFAPPLVAKRLELVDAKYIFTQESFVRGGKEVSIYETACAAKAPKAIVLQQQQRDLELRPGDQLFTDFLGDNDQFDPVEMSPTDPTAILFSSGTTGKPKALVWDSRQMIQSAADARYHHGVTADDRGNWNTEPGWMMDRHAISAFLMNNATMTVFTGSFATEAFGQFIQDTKTTYVGIVPDFVAAWRKSGLMEQFNWSAVRRFVSTGKPSNRGDYLYLPYLTEGKAAVIEYLGGTEIGGGYITGSMIHPSVLSAFCCWSLGMGGYVQTNKGELCSPDEIPNRLQGGVMMGLLRFFARLVNSIAALVSLPVRIAVTTEGEFFLDGPGMGLSQKMWSDPDGVLHHKAYYADTPRGPEGQKLRKHGDVFRFLGRLKDGTRYIRSLGRSGAGMMNPHGVNCSAVELENHVITHDKISEAAAAEVLQQTGDSKLVFFVVLTEGEKFSEGDITTLRKEMARILKTNHSSLLSVDDIVIVDALPKTPTAKVQNRLISDMYQASQSSGRPANHIWSIDELRSLIAKS